ncbi:MAG: hypothetical protein KGL35_13880, partial [Bradyrhizobium sp.]|nr:hypothetical protein [Bradyrhizobium sp.]
MRTIYCPKSHEEIARASAGKAYGHVPGHQYHDVDAILTLRKSTGIYRCQLVESWGSAQGYDEEHGRREVATRSGCYLAAMREAQDRAAAAGMDSDYVSQA